MRSAREAGQDGQWELVTPAAARAPDEGAKVSPLEWLPREAEVHRDHLEDAAEAVVLWKAKGGSSPSGMERSGETQPHKKFTRRRVFFAPRT